VLLSFIQNIALLAMLAIGLQILSQKIEARSGKLNFAAGLLFGLVCIVGMMSPVQFAPGIIYDGRSLVLSLAGVFSGPIPALIAAMISGAYRLFLGGSGAWVGVGVIVESAGLGIGLHYLRQHNRQWEKPARLLLFGFLVHGIMLIIQLFLPDGVGWLVWQRFGLAIMIGYSLAFLLAALIFIEMEQRRKATQTVSESESYLRAVIQSAADGFVIVDINRRIIEVNDAYCTMTGFSREELLKKSINDLEAAESYKDIQERNIRLQMNGSEWFETKHHRKDGTVFPVDVSITLLPERGGRFICFCRDLSDRKRSQEKLTLLGGLLDAAPVAIMIHDIQGHIFFANQTSLAMHGYHDKDEFFALNLNQLDEPESEAEKAKQANHFSTYGEATFEVIHKRKDGSQFPMAIRVKKAEWEDKPAILSIGLDITDSKNLEEQLRQAQKLESIGRLAGGIAHDFNNMLGVILGHAELVLEDLPKDNPLWVDVEEIRKAAQRSANLTHQLLAFARRQTIVPRKLDLNKTVESMLIMLRRLIGEDVELIWAPVSLPAIVMIDPIQVDQILANLVVNSRDAIRHAVGRIVIQTELKSFDKDFCNFHSGYIPGNYVLLSVSDNGFGMDAAVKEKVFEPFFTTKPIGAGTGLGLATVYGIVKQNCGFINLESELGKGTVIRIYLPTQIAESTSDARISEVIDNARHGETILLVEDEPALLDLTGKMLCHLGYTVLSAHTPEEAMYKAEQHPEKIHLLITDVVMPKMNGRDLAQLLAASLPDFKCLFMSGYAADVLTPQGISDEEFEFIQKPFSVVDLDVKIRSVLDKDQVPSRMKSTS
jgi:two-component system, cell cycle sensor histidine kinase and response regulator CckA